ncbi:MAG TPA: YkoF family thiamine/hydroxymethylpyrimidine-binding protein [Candidatus Saccharimonadia bacterium]|jgi:uncharacterized protein YqgV (UPF0045/DUF77 family)|nr:YkoF family thiamine/hydroxymethylpyrimidine-binding protein [Candidatus Saccharimonadia bacterium]
MKVGCRFSLYPMTDNYEHVILEAISGLKATKTLEVETGDISTMLNGPAEEVFAAVQACFTKAAKLAGHVVVTATFSHGCPGEPDGVCDPRSHQQPAAGTKIARPKAAGVPASAQFALYPLDSPTYMDTIYGQIEAAKSYAKVTPEHFCTRLDSDAADIFAVLYTSLSAGAAAAPHAVVTATVSKK